MKISKGLRVVFIRAVTDNQYGPSARKIDCYAMGRIDDPTLI